MTWERTWSDIFVDIHFVFPETRWGDFSYNPLKPGKLRGRGRHATALTEEGDPKIQKSGFKVYVVSDVSMKWTVASFLGSLFARQALARKLTLRHYENTRIFRTVGPMEPTNIWFGTRLTWMGIKQFNSAAPFRLFKAFCDGCDVHNVGIWETVLRVYLRCSYTFWPLRKLASKPGALPGSVRDP